MLKQNQCVEGLDKEDQIKDVTLRNGVQGFSESSKKKIRLIINIENSNF